jgi:hypothetical protein
MVESLTNRRQDSPLEVLREEIPAIKEAYYEEEGVSRLFKRLLREVVSPWMQEWLCSVFFLAERVPFRDTIPPSSLPWPDLKLQEQFVLITDYFYFLRNLYTHTSKHAQTQELGEFRAPTRDSLSFSIRYSDVPEAITDRVGWFVALRSDLSESEVIRMVCVHLLRKWLRYRDDRDFVETYLTRLTFRFSTYSLVQELIYNSNTIGKWALIESRLTLLNRFDLSSLLLATTSATRLVGLSSSTGRYRPFLVDQLPTFLELTSKLNDSVREAFAEATSCQTDIRRADQLIRLKLRELAASRDAMRLLRTIDKLWQSLDQTLAIPFY